MPRLSVIIPFLNEAENLSKLHGRLEAVGAQLPDVSLEIILVDDGSSDRSIEVIKDFPASAMAVRVVKLSRNWGGHAAIAAGVQTASGDILTFLSADLQDPPEIIVQLYRKWTEGFRICWATRQSRADGLSSQVTGAVYYWLLRKFALPQMPVGGVDLCLVDKKVIRAMGNLQERNSNVFNLLMWAGFEQCFIPYDRGEREHGASRWTFAKRLKLFIDSLIGFSFMPIRLISSLGAGLSILGLCYAGLIIVRWFIYGAPVTGWSSIMVALLMLSGVQMLMLGVLSEYLWRALDASRNRPLYLIDDVLNIEPKASPVLTSPASRPTARCQEVGA
jgi:glycosyltransferase involved in cell wall biosynthesis